MPEPSNREQKLLQLKRTAAKRYAIMASVPEEDIWSYMPLRVLAERYTLRSFRDKKITSWTRFIANLFPGSRSFRRQFLAKVGQFADAYILQFLVLRSISF